MTETIVPLESVRITDALRVGTKAAVLGTLTAAWFPVPPGMCVTTAAFRLAFEPWRDQIDAVLQQHDVRDPDGAASAAKIIDQLLTDLEVPEAVMGPLRDALPAIASPGIPLAVRSSATAEDTATASFAGLYHSVLGVLGADALQAAIVDVWRSFYNPAALVTRCTLRNPRQREDMAVLILPMVFAECAGVCFSMDPVHHRRDRVVITSAWGLGAGVVDGSVACDTAWVRRDGATEGFELEEQRITEQVEEILLDSRGGLTRAPVPEDRRRAACIPDAWLERVAQFGVAAEVLLGCPQDVEWAVADGQLWVLQSRPITTLPQELAKTPSFPVSWENEQEQRLAWVYYPYWRYVLKPLEIDYARDRETASIESCLYRGGDRYERTKVVNGRLYTCWAMTDQAAGDRRIRRAAMADLKARLRRQSITPWEHWGPEIIQATQRLSAFDPRDASGTQLAEHLEDARGAFRRHWTIHGSRLSISHQPLYAAYAAVAGLTESSVRAAVDQLLEGEETTTTRLIDGLYALACAARQAPSVSAIIADPPPDVLEQLTALPEATALCAQLEAFLDVFGDRTGVGYGWDATICAPTWRETPTQVLRIVAHYLDPSVEPPARARARARAQRDKLIDKACDACSDQKAVAELRSQLAYARRAEAFMEEHNHYIDQMMNGQLRRAIMAAAHWLVERGTCTSTEDVFWLRYDEILHALRADVPDTPADGPGSLTDLPHSLARAISTRRVQHAEWEKLEAPPLLGIPYAALPPRPPLQVQARPKDSPEHPQKAHVKGLAASAGRRRGRARVVPTSVQLPDLAPGDVLVAENMGPRWTPLIPILSGLVLDTGAVGQHHAIIAREYGVPAVVATRNATRRIADGAWVTVDGSTGIVELE